MLQFGNLLGNRKQLIRINAQLALLPADVDLQQDILPDSCLFRLFIDDAS